MVSAPTAVSTGIGWETDEDTIVPLMTWNDTYAVGVKQFDEQHQGLFACLNDLHDAMIMGQANSVIENILTRLIQYTREHFSAEEAAMGCFSYPDLKSHRLVHGLLTAQVEDFAVRFHSGELLLSVSLMRFLKDWLKQHILLMDKAYSHFLNEHGVT
jgi:hemerythrin